MNDDDFVSLLNESCACGAGGDGLEMLMQNLAKIHEYSGELMGLLGREAEVEDWVEDKLSKASQSLSDVKHYVEYRNSAYSMHMGAIEMHGGDVQMGQRAGVSGRLEGDRMPVMSQIPAMTPQSSMGNAVGDCGVEDGTRDHGRPSFVGPCGDKNKGPDVEGMQELPGDEAGPAIEPVEDEPVDMEDEPMDDMDVEDDDDMTVISLSEAWSETESLSPEHPDYFEPTITSDYPGDDEFASDDIRANLEPKTLADVQGRQGPGEISRLATEEPHILVSQIKDLASRQGMDPQEYLASLGFDKTHGLYNMVASDSLWGM